MSGSDVRRIEVEGGFLEVAVTLGGPQSSGATTSATGGVSPGRTVMLVHGFPHTRELWSPLIGMLDPTWRTIAPDLRGAGGSSRATTGYDATSVAGDLLAVLDQLEVEQVDLVAIDAGVSPSFLLALRHPDRVRRLVLMEATLGSLPGAESFTSGGGPWWFGFHQVPGLAETVLEGHEAEYLDFFYRTGTWDGAGIDPVVRASFVESYSGRESLRCAFEYYRAMSTTDRQVREAVSGARLRVPTMAVGAAPVGALLHQQLRGVADDLRGELVAECGHIIPLDSTARLTLLLADFLGGA